MAGGVGFLRAVPLPAALSCVALCRGLAVLGEMAGESGVFRVGGRHPRERVLRRQGGRDGQSRKLGRNPQKELRRPEMEGAEPRALVLGVPPAAALVITPPARRPARARAVRRRSTAPSGPQRCTTAPTA